MACLISGVVIETDIGEIPAELHDVGTSGHPNRFQWFLVFKNYKKENWELCKVGANRVYCAGFTTRDKAEQWAKAKGWLPNE